MTLASRFITWDSELIYINPPVVSLSTISTSHRLRAPEPDDNDDSNNNGQREREWKRKREWEWESANNMGLITPAASFTLSIVICERDGRRRGC